MNTDYMKDFARRFANNPEADTQIVFPTLQYVQESHFGLDSGGTTWLQQMHYNAPTFPR